MSKEYKYENIKPKKILKICTGKEFKLHSRAELQMTGTVCAAYGYTILYNVQYFSVVD